MAETPPTPEAQQSADAREPLTFKVAPNIVEDLGLNLYTSLPRVLAEFVANAHDADSPDADIFLDYDAIQAARKKLSDDHKDAKKKATAEGRKIEDLVAQTLPDDLTITIADRGFGMSRGDLATKFLVAGRRRRREEDPNRTPSGRLVMGRKGLGKLAGFGVGRRVEVVTRKKGEAHATKITLTYDELVKKHEKQEVVITEEVLATGGGFVESGTKIVLSQLMYDPTKSMMKTIVDELAEHFEMIQGTEFVVRVNGEVVKPMTREYAFAWPQPEVPAIKLIEDSVVTDDGLTCNFEYRMRFTADEGSLLGARRGVRVYARGRLAAIPSLLDADTNMHGFRMTDYLDGVVNADFLDAYPADFIATDRQTLRWESPLLSPLYRHLGEQITIACKEAQKLRDGVAPGIVKKDPFTLKAIEKQGLVGRDRTLAIRIGTYLSASCKQGVKDPLYQKKFPEILRGIGQGNLLTAIASLAAEDHPDLDRVVARLTNLTNQEIGGFISIARARVDGIEALKKIVDAQDFKKGHDEKQVQKLFEKCPWMVDSTYSPMLTADSSLTTLYQNLAKELKIGSYAVTNADGDDDRPDLVFLLGNEGGGRLIIVELKAPNVQLNIDHLTQLKSYMRRAKVWLGNNGKSQVSIHGDLIGSIDQTSTGKKVDALRQEMDERGPDAKWRVRTFVGVLTETQQAHDGILKVHAQAPSNTPDEDEDEGIEEEAAAE